MKKYGGKTIVIGPSGRVGGESYNFNEHKQNIVTTLNELGKAITDIGLIAALHQHTGTAVETRDETYATMEAVDTRYVKFGPDIGQLQKGGVDPVAVVKTSCRSSSTCTSRIGSAGRRWPATARSGSARWISSAFST